MKLPIDYDSSHWSVRKKAREQYVEKQGGSCCHCSAPLTGGPARYIEAMKIKTSLFPKMFFKWPVHLHHNRETGLTIGAVHNKCNAVLWQYHGE